MTKTYIFKRGTRWVVYVTHPEATDFITRAQAFYPGAYALEVDSNGVLVHCDPCQGNHRDIPGGTVRLGTSPATAALAREILAFSED